MGVLFNNIAVGVGRPDIRPVCKRHLGTAPGEAHNIFDPNHDMTSYECSSLGDSQNATRLGHCRDGVYVVAHFDAGPGADVHHEGQTYSAYTIFGCRERLGFHINAKEEHTIRPGVASFVAIARFQGQPMWQPRPLEGFALCVSDAAKSRRAACRSVVVDEYGNETMAVSDEVVVHDSASAHLAMATLGDMRAILCLADWHAGESGHCLVVGSMDLLFSPGAVPIASLPTMFSAGITRYTRLQALAEHRGQHVQSAYRAMVYYQHGSVVRLHPAMCNIVTALESTQGVTVGPNVTVDDGLTWSLSLT